MEKTCDVINFYLEETFLNLLKNVFNESLKEKNYINILPGIVFVKTGDFLTLPVPTPTSDACDWTTTLGCDLCVFQLLTDSTQGSQLGSIWAVVPCGSSCWTKSSNLLPSLGRLGRSVTLSSLVVGV